MKLKHLYEIVSRAWQQEGIPVVIRIGDKEYQIDAIELLHDRLVFHMEKHMHIFDSDIGYNKTKAFVSLKCACGEWQEYIARVKAKDLRSYQQQSIDEFADEAFKNGPVAF